MIQPSARNLTQLLQAWSDGNQEALTELTPLIHAELHRLASRYMAQERRGHMLQTTALVNEAFLRLVNWKSVQWQNRAHFFGVSAALMRRVLVDFAREERCAKRGGDALLVSLEQAASIPRECNGDLLALDEALDRLSTLDPRQSRVVEMKFFGGMEMEEIAEVLQVSLGTVKRDWSLARLWLKRELAKDWQ